MSSGWRPSDPMHSTADPMRLCPWCIVILQRFRTLTSDLIYHGFATNFCSRASAPEANFLRSLDLKPCPIFFLVAWERLRMRTLLGIPCWPQKDPSCWMFALSVRVAVVSPNSILIDSPADSASQATFFSIFLRQETATGNQSFRHVSAMFSDRNDVEGYLEE